MKQGNNIIRFFSRNMRNKGFCLIAAFVFSLLGQSLLGKWTTQWKAEMESTSNFSVAAVESRPRAVGTIAVAGTRMDGNGIDRAVLDFYDDENGTRPTILTSIETDHSVGRFTNFTALAWSEGGHDLLVAGNYVGGIRIKTDHKVAELTNADEEPTNHAFIAQFSFSGDGVSVHGLTKFKSDQAIALCRDPSDGGVFWFLTGSGKIHKLNLDEKQQVLSVEETISTGLAGTTDLFVGENELAVIGNNNNKGTLKTFTKVNSSVVETFSGENHEHFTSLAGDGNGGFYVTGKTGGDERESEERLLIRSFGKNNWRVDATGSTRSWGSGISIVGSRIFVTGTFNNEITVGGNELFINEQVDGAILPGVVLVELGKENGDSIRLQSLDDAISYSNCLDESGTLLAGSFLNRNGELLSTLVKLHMEESIPWEVAFTDEQLKQLSNVGFSWGDQLIPNGDMQTDVKGFHDIYGWVHDPIHIMTNPENGVREMFWQNKESKRGSFHRIFYKPELDPIESGDIIMSVIVVRDNLVSRASYDRYARTMPGAWLGRQYIGKSNANGVVWGDGYRLFWGLIHVNSLNKRFPNRLHFGLAGWNCPEGLNIAYYGAKKLLSFDSDGDGKSDAEEILVWKTDPIGDRKTPLASAPTFVPASPGIDYKKKLSEAELRLEALRAMDKKMDTDVGERRERLAKLDDEISVVDKSLHEVHSSLAACEQVCEGLKSDHRAIDTSIGVEDARIYGLNGQIGGAEKQFTDLKKDKSKLEEELAEAERKALVPHTPGWHFIDGKGWLWTHPDYFPLVYSEQVAGWFYYEPGSQTPWLYYEYNTESWQEW
jgi:hypothetical protein